jgi:hypothetical protein
MQQGVAADDQVEARAYPQRFQQRPGEFLGLVGDAHQLVAARECVQHRLGAGIEAAVHEHVLAIRTSEEFQSPLQQRRIRLAVCIAGEGTLHQLRHAVPYPAPHQFPSRLRAAQLTHHAIHRTRDIGRAVYERPIQIECNELDRHRQALESSWRMDLIVAA